MSSLVLSSLITSTASSLSSVSSELPYRNNRPKPIRDMRMSRFGPEDRPGRSTDTRCPTDIPGIPGSCFHIEIIAPDGRFLLPVMTMVHPFCQNAVHIFHTFCGIFFPQTSHDSLRQAQTAFRLPITHMTGGNCQKSCPDRIRDTCEAGRFHLSYLPDESGYRGGSLRQNPSGICG